MDVFELREELSELTGTKVSRIYINGKDFINEISNFEKRFGEELAGSYSPLTKRELLESILDSLSWKRKHVPLLACGDCEDQWCWPLTGNVSENWETIVWSDFSQPYRDDWDFSNFPSFKFEKSQFFETLWIDWMDSIEEERTFDMVFKSSKTIMAFSIFCTISVIPLSIWYLVSEAQKAWWILNICYVFIFWLFILIWPVSATKRVFATEEGIRLKDLFSGTKSYRYDDMSSYRTAQGQYGSRKLLIELKGAKRKIIDIEIWYLEHGGNGLLWALSRKVRNADNEELLKELNELRQISITDAQESLVKKELRHWKTALQVVNAASLLLIWAVFLLVTWKANVHLNETYIAAGLTALVFLTIVGTIYSDGLVKFWTSRREDSLYADSFPIFAIQCFWLAIISLDFQLISYTNALIFACVIGISIWLWIATNCPEMYKLHHGSMEREMGLFWKTALTALFIVMSSFSIGYPSFVLANCLLDGSESEETNGIVQDKWISKGKITSYDIEVHLDDSKENPVFSVNKENYGKISINETIVLMKKHGFLWTPWIRLK